jgi:hypothetical protein
MVLFFQRLNTNYMNRFKKEIKLVRAGPNGRRHLIPQIFYIQPGQNPCYCFVHQHLQVFIVEDQGKGSLQVFQSGRELIVVFADQLTKFMEAAQIINRNNLKLWHASSKARTGK